MSIKKILLTSDGFVNSKIGHEFLALIGKKPIDIKVLFVTTASRLEEEKFYVKDSEKELIEFGLAKENILWVDNLENIEIENYDVVYVCGGNTFYLMHEMRRTGFDKQIINFINSGKVYVGVSAGSVIMGPMILHVKNLDKNDIGLKDMNGFNVTDKIILPHYKNEEEEKVKEFERENHCEVLRLQDGQALEVLGADVRIIE